MQFDTVSEPVLV